MNSTFEQKSTCFLLTDKLTKSTGNNQGGLDWLFPTWIPGTCAALFHDERQVTKGIPAYIREAAHMQPLKEYLIQRSKEATGCDKSWDEATCSYDSRIDWWRHYGEVFKKLSHGRHIQISKYTNNDLVHTKQCLATFDNNRVDGRCFACNRLWEDTTHILHILTCTCDARCDTRKAACLIYQQKLTRMNTPNFLTHLICNSMDSWLA
jgi:hypothetical protein